MKFNQWTQLIDEQIKKMLVEVKKDYEEIKNSKKYKILKGKICYKY